MSVSSMKSFSVKALALRNHAACCNVVRAGEYWLDTAKQKDSSPSAQSTLEYFHPVFAAYIGIPITHKLLEHAYSYLPTVDESVYLSLLYARNSGSISYLNR